jgi:thiol-disulfide isomerase/thioredoxin
MRKLLLLSGFLFIVNAAFSQTSPRTDSVPSYATLKNLPSFVIYKAPDSTAFNQKDLQTGMPELLMIFSPDCGHCQHVTKEILDNISHFKKTKILMITWLPYSEMMQFYKTYNIAGYPQITMAWDSKFFFLPYYHVTTYPKLIVYNKKGNFVKEFQGEIEIENVWKSLGKK